MNKIVVAIDSFKGSLSSREAAEAAEQGIKTIFPQCEVLHFPVADGGEGILEILTDAFHGHTVPLVAHNPLMQKITTQFGKTAARHWWKWQGSAACHCYLPPGGIPCSRPPMVWEKSLQKP